MKVIGIVGGIGAGKSTVVELMSKMTPLLVISADQIGHDVLLKGHEAYKPVLEAFGKDILDEQGEISRRKLGVLVFENPDQLMRLNQITHPIITDVIKSKIAWHKVHQPNQHIILEAALLIESGLIDLVDVVIAVYADVETRLKRVVLRDKLDKEHIQARIRAQKDWEELKKVADEIIDNSISLEETNKQIESVLARL